MIDFILQYKWLFLILGEIIFWVSLLGFFIVRYAFGLEKLSKYFIFIWLFSDAWLLVLGIMDYRNTGTFDTFQVIIVIFLLYALTFGRNDMRKLDRWMKRNIRKWKGEPPIEEEKEEKLYGLAYAAKQGKEFALHALMYAVALVIFSFFSDFQSPVEVLGMNDFGDTLGNIIEKGWFADPIIGKITGIWMLVLLIDAVITLSYFIFPKKA